MGATRAKTMGGRLKCATPPDVPSFCLLPFLVSDLKIASEVQVPPSAVR